MDDENPYSPNHSAAPIQTPPKRNRAAKIGFIIGLLGFAGLLCTVFIYYNSYGIFMYFGEREVFAPLMLFPIGFVFSVAGVFRAPRGLAIAGILINFIGLLSVPGYVSRYILGA